MCIVFAGESGWLEKMTCISVLHAWSGTTKVAWCHLILLTLLTMPGFVVHVPDKHLY